jgi:outer membrane protein assembly factor BamE (lipoprotein component of BamABCDE complex)
MELRVLLEGVNLSADPEVLQRTLRVSKFGRRSPVISSARSMMRNPIMVLLIAVSVLITGCMSAHNHYERTHGPREREMTVGTVQREIRKGMSAAEVAEVLGSPNIVTTDGETREVWIYDKISTDITYSRDSGGGIIGLIIGGIAGDVLVGGGAAGGYSRSSGAESKTQRTLTVVIKFDEQNRVRDFAYHSSRF